MHGGCRSARMDATTQASHLRAARMEATTESGWRRAARVEAAGHCAARWGSGYWTARVEATLHRPRHLPARMEAPGHCAPGCGSGYRTARVEAALHCSRPRHSRMEAAGGGHRARLHKSCVLHARMTHRAAEAWMHSHFRAARHRPVLLEPGTTGHSAWMLQRRLTAETLVTTENLIAPHDLVVAHHIAITVVRVVTEALMAVAAQVSAVRMEVVEMAREPIWCAVPMMIVIVVSPAEGIAIDQEHLIAADDRGWRSADIADPVDAIIAGDKRVLVRHRSACRGGESRRWRTEPEAAPRIEGLRLLQAIGVRRIGGDPSRTVHQGHLGNIGAVRQQADVATGSQLL